MDPSSASNQPSVKEIHLNSARYRARSLRPISFSNSYPAGGVASIAAFAADDVETDVVAFVADGHGAATVPGDVTVADGNGADDASIAADGVAAADGVEAVDAVVAGVAGADAEPVCPRPSSLSAFCPVSGLTTPLPPGRRPAWPPSPPPPSSPIHRTHTSSPSSPPLNLSSYGTTLS